MVDHFSLSKQEFLDNGSAFSTLEITSEEAVDKNYQEPKKYIKPLKSGNPCVQVVNIHTESDGLLTAREFNYRKKLFAELNITSEEVVKKTFEEIISILEGKDNGFKETRKNCDELRMKIQKTPHDPSLNYSEKIIKIMEFKGLQRELSQYLAKPSMQLFDYVIHLENKKNLIVEDKKALALKFVERENAFQSMESLSRLPLDLLTTITIVHYLSLWIIAFNIITNIACYLLIMNMKKYQNSEISNYIQLGCKLLIGYPLSAFSVYLLATNFVLNGLTIGGVILGPLLGLAILIEALATSFSKGCEIYTEKHRRDLLEEDPRDRVQKATDLLKWYDLRGLLMPIIMPLVKKYFVEVTNELAERNFDEVNTNMSGVSQPIEALEFTQQVSV